MTELWQLYGEDGEPLDGQAGNKNQIYSGLLHGAAHVWIWRKHAGKTEVLLQKRALAEHPWKNRWDISAAGHIDLGEEPIMAAVRETQEEVGVDLTENDLTFVTKRHDNLVSPSGKVEDEFRWVYALKFNPKTHFILEEGRVDAVTWRPIIDVKAELADPKKQDNYVPQGSKYFQEVFDFIENLAAKE